MNCHTFDFVLLCLVLDLSCYCIAGRNPNSNSKSGLKLKAPSASKSGPCKSNGSAFGYNYPSVELQVTTLHRNFLIEN